MTTTGIMLLLLGFFALLAVLRAVEAIAAGPGRRWRNKRD
jgi:hypothetical protein